jgi:hypothetical protein
VQCNEVKGSEEFWADRKMPGGLMNRCIACSKARRRELRGGQAVTPVEAHTATPLDADAKAVIDQAVAERDRAVAEAAELRTRVSELLARAVIPRDDERADLLLAEVRAMSEDVSEILHRMPVRRQTWRWRLGWLCQYVGGEVRALADWLDARGERL